MTKKGENLNQIVTKTATQWKVRAAKDRANRKHITRAQKFALELLEYLEENNIKQKELAQLMGVSPQQVNKILRGKANLTFETLDKIEEALGIAITSPQINAKKPVFSQTIASTMQLVHKRPSKPVQENIITSGSPKKNAILETTIENMDYYKFTADQI